jgi:hypothetical protein
MPVERLERETGVHGTTNPALLEGDRAAELSVDGQEGAGRLAAAMQRARSVDPKTLTAQLKVIDALAPVTNNMRFRADGEQKYGVVSVYKASNAGVWEAMTRSDNW